MRSKGLGILCAFSLVLGQVAAAQQAPAKKEAPPPPPELKTGPATVAPHWSKNKYPDSIPEGATYYIVVKGDTLWDISGKFLGKPFLWPQIWNENKYISDAHWIYPGDPVILPKVALIAERAGEAPLTPGGRPGEEGLPGEAGVPGGPGAVLVPITEETSMQCSHYIVKDREDEGLHVVGSELGAAKNAFADRDILYLNKGSNAGIKPGDVYALHHAAYDVKHPNGGGKLGTKVETTGWLRVILVQENTATAIVEQACADIHAGDYLRPFEKMSVPLIVRRPPPDRLTPPTGKAQGYVVDIAEDSMIAGSGQLLSIDLGSENGLAPGNLLVVYRIVYPSVPTSRNVIGEIAVLTVRERTATAKVIYSSDAIMNGDPVELR